MAYSIIVSPRAQKEIENAIDYYEQYNSNAPLHFIEALASTYHTLEINAFFNIRYKNIRSLKINKFPYSVYFVIDQAQNTVRILSCFHNKVNPDNRPSI